MTTRLGRGLPTLTHEISGLAGRNISAAAGAPSGSGFADGQGPNALFSGLSGIAVAGDGSLYVADRAARALRRVTPQGEVSTLAGGPGLEGDTDGPLALARFHAPLALTRDAAGNIYVLTGDNAGACLDDNTAGAVPYYRSLKVRKISPAGTVTTLAGAGVSGLAARTVVLPGGIAADAAGNVYLSVTQTTAPEVVFGVGCGSFRGASTASYVQKVSPTGQVTVFSGSTEAAGGADGAAADSRFRWITQLALDRFGTLWAADSDNQAVRRIDPAGRVTTPIGQLSAPAATDIATGALPGRLLQIPALAVLPSGAVVLASGPRGSQMVLRTERR